MRSTPKPDGTQRLGQAVRFLLERATTGANGPSCDDAAVTAGEELDGVRASNGADA
jgi:hypothetical protein